MNGIAYYTPIFAILVEIIAVLLLITHRDQYGWRAWLAALVVAIAGLVILHTWATMVPSP